MSGAREKSDRRSRRGKPSGVSVDVVAQKESKYVEDVDVKGKPEGEVEQDQVECRGSGASDGDVREKDSGQGT